MPASLELLIVLLLLRVELLVSLRVALRLVHRLLLARHLHLVLRQCGGFVVVLVVFGLVLVMRLKVTVAMLEALRLLNAHLLDAREVVSTVELLFLRTK